MLCAAIVQFGNVFIKLFRSLLELRKFTSHKLRNSFATLVMEFSLKGGLNQMMLRLCFCFWVLCCSFWIISSLLWYLLFFKAVLYSDLLSLKFSSLVVFLLDLLFTVIGKCLMTWLRWLENMLTFNKKSLEFLHGQYMSFARLKETY